MNTLTEAKKLLAANLKNGTAPIESMTSEQKNALAEDFAANSHFQSAAHFATGAERKLEFEVKFRDYLGSLRR